MGFGCKGPNITNYWYLFDLGQGGFIISWRALLVLKFLDKHWKENSGYVVQYVFEDLSRSL